MIRALMLGVAAGCLPAIALVGSHALAGERPDFHLVDSAGHPYSLASFPPDGVVLLYFGYTTCLRACPTTLDSMAAALDQLGARGGSVRPVFVDMDPDRAALASLPLYMQTFGPSFLGLTGTREQVAEAAQAFKVEVERLQFSPDPTDYAMLHASPIFVLRPGTARAASLPADSQPETIAAAVAAVLAERPQG